MSFYIIIAIVQNLLHYRLFQFII